MKRYDYFADEEKVRIVLKKMFKKIHHCDPYAKHPYNGNDFRGSFDAELASGTFQSFINNDNTPLFLVKTAFKSCKNYYFNLYKKLYNKTYPEIRIVLQDVFVQKSGNEKRIKAKWCGFKDPDKKFSEISKKIYDLPDSRRVLFFEQITKYWTKYQVYSGYNLFYFYPKNEEWYAYKSISSVYKQDFCLDEILCCLYDSDFKDTIKSFVEDALFTKSELLIKHI